jgi:hypothetical protein
MEELFGEVIHAYTRADALRDGVLVAAPEDLATEAGFRVPVAVTAAVYEDCVHWPESEEAYQDERGRWWDLLFMGRLAAMSGRSESRLNYKIVRHPRGASGLDADTKGPQEVTLSLHIGPGDEGEPVITIMQPGED